MLFKFFSNLNEIGGLAWHENVQEKLQNFVSQVRSRNINVDSNVDSTSSLDALRKYFAKQNRLYQSCWFTNKLRQQQASELFSAMEDCLNYEAMLEQLINTQIEIVRADQGKNRNQKGYSRLYDLTVEMFVQVANAYVKSSTNNAQSYQKIDNLLRRSAQASWKVYRNQSEIVELCTVYNDLPDPRMESKDLTKLKWFSDLQTSRLQHSGTFQMLIDNVLNYLGGVVRLSSKYRKINLYVQTDLRFGA